MKINLLNFAIVLFLTTFTVATAPPIDVVFIIQSQDIEYHRESCQKLKRNILKQSIELQPKYKIKVHLVHEIFNYPGGWTIHNLIRQIVFLQSNNDRNTMTNRFKSMEIINANTRWLVFCEESTRIRVATLMERLEDENHMQPLFLGYPLYDREPTIIHHFAFFENPKWFPYPMLRAGFVLSMPLVNSIANLCANKNNKFLEQQFSIDAGHELARFIYDNIPIPILTQTTSPQQKRAPNKNLYPETSCHATENENKTEKKNAETQRTTRNHCTTLEAESTANIFDVPHSDYCTMTTNEIKVKRTSDNVKASGVANTNTTSVIQKQKIILKKASYICPADTWENSNSSSIANHDDYKSCAMYAESALKPASSMSCIPVKREEVYFAVKTCSKYRKERLPIILETWARYAKHIKYFSDISDYTVPTTYTDVPNVEMGHCAKTLQILKLALNDINNYNKKQQLLLHHSKEKFGNPQIKWLLLADDDTLLSVSGVCQVLGCYNSMTEIYLGERYGYRLFAQDGFNYITGGGGIALSLPVVKLILQYCSCPSPMAPDDMVLGSCLHSLQLKAIHSSRFHQARPNDYSLELLKLEPPVSFHKFWQLDPVDVYKYWFAAQDHTLYADTELGRNEINDEDSKLNAQKPSAKTEFFNLNKIPISHHVDL